MKIIILLFMLGINYAYSMTADEVNSSTARNCEEFNQYSRNSSYIDSDELKIFLSVYRQYNTDQYLDREAKSIDLAVVDLHNIAKNILESSQYSKLATTLKDISTETLSTFNNKLISTDQKLDHLVRVRQYLRVQCVSLTSYTGQELDKGLGRFTEWTFYRENRAWMLLMPLSVTADAVTFPFYFLRGLYEMVTDPGVFFSL